VNAQAEARAFIAGMQHVLDCPGCPICLVEPPLEHAVPENIEEQTLEKSIQRTPE
jgi:hypothetical protein